jgi:XRE family transcriptional regulator, fatty acid utilization regulator
MQPGHLTDENIRLIFGLKVRQLRQQRQLSLSELATKSALSVSYLNEIEKGKKYPRGEKIAGLANALQVKYDQLVSVQVNKSLEPFIELLNSNVFREIPLELFGIEKEKVIELISEAPLKVSAFINTLIEIARNYNFNRESFYFAAQRSYQEMHDNYFDELERDAERFIHEFKIDAHPSKEIQKLKKILTEKYNYEIIPKGITDFKELRHFRSILIPGKKNRLYVNENLDATQMAFLLGKEIAFNYLQLENRSYTSSWLKAKSFDEVLNNFKASYFSNALLVQRRSLLPEIEYIFSQAKWDPKYFLQLIQRYHVSPETFLHRLTSLMPKYFGLSNLFFLRFNDSPDSDKFSLTKELHLARLHSPYANERNEHYCHRWISITILKDIKKQKETQPLIGIQRSHYFGTENEYLCISVARNLRRKPGTNTSVTIGLLLTPEMKKKITWWNDPKIPAREVNQTCERCAIINCKERAAQPFAYEEENQQKEIEIKLNEFIKKNKEA